MKNRQSIYSPQSCHPERSEGSDQANDESAFFTPGQMPPKVGMTDWKKECSVRLFSKGIELPKRRENVFLPQKPYDFDLFSG